MHNPCQRTHEISLARTDFRFEREHQPGVRLAGLMRGSRILGHRVFAVIENGVSDRNIGNAQTRLVHDARCLDADPSGKCRLPESAVLPGPSFSARGIDPGGRDGEPHSATASVRLVNLDDLQNFWTSVFAELNCFHMKLDFAVFLFMW